MSGHKFPASLPRKMYWSDEVGGCASCPDCSGTLESEQHIYVMATRRGGSFNAHIVGNTAGHFCGNCSVVVLDRDEFERFVTLAVRESNGVDYAVMGIVDLDAVPGDKRSLPFDDDTNPVPLVEFTNLGKRKDPGTSRLNGSSKRKRKKRMKRR